MNMNKRSCIASCYAAFDTVDHEILKHRLQTEFCLGDPAVLSWFVSCVTHRSQRVSVYGVISDVLCP